MAQPRCARHIVSLWLLGPLPLCAGTRNVGVIVLNQSAAPVSVIENAEDRSREYFLPAGIRLTWINAVADIDWEGPEVILRAAILSHAPRTRRIESCGSALPKRNGGLQIFVYYDRVAALSRAADLPIQVVLSGVLAHEIGHMLLRSSEHSVAGLMRGEWGIRELEELGQGRLGFTPQQKRQMGNDTVSQGRKNYWGNPTRRSKSRNRESDRNGSRTGSIFRWSKPGSRLRYAFSSHRKPSSGFARFA